MQRENRSLAFLGVYILLGFCLLSFAGTQSALASTPIPVRKPATITPVYSYPKSSAIPAPDKKPDFSRPDLTQLLSFGDAPKPRKKPMPTGRGAISPENVQLYRNIFENQAIGRWTAANEAFEQLSDFRLRGHVLFQRYMHPVNYTASFDELLGWLDMYSDHPGATKIYKLALARMPRDFTGHVPRPKGKSTGVPIIMDVLYDKGQTYRSKQSRTQKQEEDIKALEKSIGNDLRRGGPTRAFKRLTEDERALNLDTVEYDQIQAQIANSYLLLGKIDKARELAMASARRSGPQAPTAGWIGGLAAWRLGKYQESADMFELCAISPYSSPWTISAASYWASRAHTRAGNVKKVSTWLRRAADHPRTFYGLIATRALGWDFDFNWDTPKFTQERKDLLLSLPEGYRAIALVEVGQYHLAEDELKRINPGSNEELQKALLAYASFAGLPSYSMRLASAFKHPSGDYYDAALYPMLPWRPQSGYKIDQALIHALIRQESKFNPRVESHSGATGLMQLMPATASFVTGSKKYRNAEGQHKLKDPQTNLDIGQRYIESLLYQDVINFDLFSLAVAYNAGPGNLKRWKTNMTYIRDPLLFVESIPIAETRAFVEKVMANYWVYRIRLGQPTPSLDAVVEGDWARYVRMDNVKKASLQTSPDKKVPLPVQKPLKIAENS
jgi:soluble lytic murein transglycosylase-like protein